jgi:hypothetical protein
VVSNLDAATLLAAWDAGSSQSLVRRALTLLAAAFPERSVAEWARASIGERDARLLALREELFGDALEAVAVCANCGDRLELAFSTHQVLVAQPDPPPHEGIRVESGEYAIVCRVATSADLMDVAGSAANARATLLSRCVLAVRRDGVPVDAASLPADVEQAVVEEMAMADPQADVRVEVTCPACAQAASVSFDILPYLWGEIEDWAQRLMVDVHALASAYGWSERAIVAMSARRRRVYLDLVGA